MRASPTLTVSIAALAAVLAAPALGGGPVSVPAANHTVGELTNAYDAFGASLATAGHRLAVGARGADEEGFNTGAVHLFHRTQDGWLEQPRLLSPVAQASSQFGHAIAMNDVRVVVGSPRWNDANAPDAGRVFVYRWDLGLDVPEVEISLNGVPTAKHFGESISLWNDVLVAGAPATTGGGRVDVFSASTGPWVQMQTMTSPTAADGDAFGAAVACDNTWIVIGSPGDDTQAEDGGAVFIFQWNIATESWLLEATIRPDTLSDGAGFGCDVALQGDDLLVGAYRHDTAGEDAGSVFRYRYMAGNWFVADELVPNPSMPGMEFGTSVAMNEDWFVIGAPSDGTTNARSGSVFLIPRSDGVSPVPLQLTVEEAQGLELLGTAVAIGDEAIIAGAPLDTTAGDYAGSVLLIDSVLDCDEDTVPDFIATAVPWVDDCDINGVPDVCELTPETDCDDSGALDTCEIADGTLIDSNGDGIPDTCQCPADFNGDGDVGVFEILYIVAFWGEYDPVGDIDGDGAIDTDDLLAVIGSFGPCDFG